MSPFSRNSIRYQDSFDHVTEYRFPRPIVDDDGEQERAVGERANGPVEATSARRTSKRRDSEPKVVGRVGEIGGKRTELHDSCRHVTESRARL